MFWTSIEASTEIVYSGWDSGVGWQLDMVKSRAKKKKRVETPEGEFTQ